MKGRCEASYTVVPGQPGDAPQIARLHADCFPKGWNRDEMGLYLSDPAYKVLLARSSDTGDIAGFVIYRASGDEAEILSLAVAPVARRQGIARVLWRVAWRVSYWRWMKPIAPRGSFMAASASPRSGAAGPTTRPPPVNPARTV